MNGVMEILDAWRWNANRRGQLESAECSQKCRKMGSFQDMTDFGTVTEMPESENLPVGCDQGRGGSDLVRLPSRREALGDRAGAFWT